MRRSITKKIDDGILDFNFENSQGKIFASFRMNPSDAGLAARCSTAAAKIEQMRQEAPEGAGDLEKYDGKIRELIDELLGYPASETLFIAPMTPTTILPSGEMFAVYVMDAILDAVKPELEKRQKKMQAAVEKYTKKYESV